LLEQVIAAGGHALGSLHEESEAIDALLATQRGGAFTIEEAVVKFVSERGVEPQGKYVSGFKRMALDMAPSFIVPAPDAKRTLDELVHRGIPHAVLSNGWNPLQVAKARRAGFHGEVIASADIGVQKPDPRAFAALTAALGVPPERCYYIGDDPVGDVAGAMAAGLQAVWIDNEGKTYPPGLPKAPRIVSSLSEFLSILPAVVTT
jgi:HAD superfamily hydrolase (TIGR01509 family)